ncbi:SMP-30/gluconolactonase/LRE family protein [Simiduia aestuariiviva]|uniref:Sugar lactone lactonase YvrE n=1 Tax=Simiduia aestuariiviva TaxID=1510459 RepID=A0A839USB3_9GAMM|nr:SMP-30/gluconolactonase/LRE family protein [Simiduia aestuariiviva]MBB3168408.1 sugar lactone lactonase YvrE [Simiduia aestuariiviva]
MTARSSRSIWLALIIFLGSLSAYLLAWPVAVEPVGWQAPADNGYVKEFQVNAHLSRAQALALGPYSGPEAAVFDRQGQLWVSTHEGWLLRSLDAGETFESVVNTGGRPLGLAVDHQNRLLIADAYLGLMRYSDAQGLESLVTQFNGRVLGYVNDVAQADSGAIYFTDSSSKFHAKPHGGTYAASLLDIMEHGGHGRLFRYLPSSGELTQVVDGLNFANGVATLPSSSGQADRVVVVETGAYRIWQYLINNGTVKEREVIRDNLPGFPDNIARAPDGHLWLGLVSPRSAILDRLSNKPWLRRMVQRLPAFIRPKAQHYGMIVKLGAEGEVLQQLQDPTGQFYTTTGVAESDTYLVVSRLHGTALLRIKK